MNPVSTPWTYRTVKPHTLALCIAGAFSLSTTRVAATSEMLDIGSLYGLRAEVAEISADGTVVVGSVAAPVSIWGGWFVALFHWTPSTGIQEINTGMDFITALSADGKVTVGYSDIQPIPPFLPTSAYQRAIRWTSATGAVDLGTLGGPSARANAVSADGNVIAGDANDAAADWHAFRWTPATGMTDLGTLGGADSHASAVSADGLAIVGWAENTSDQAHAFRWTKATGMTDLGTLGGLTSEAMAVSGNGGAVVGRAENASNQGRAFRWTQATGMTDLGTLGVGEIDFMAVSADGSVVVGNESIANGYQTQAFRWISRTGMVDIGGWDTTAKDLSADGEVIVGSTFNIPDGYYAFRWNATTGMQSVKDWLTENGVAVGSMLPSDATATNDDGSVVAGTLRNGNAYVARVDEYGNGLSTLADFSDSLASTSQAVDSTLTTAGTLINGAHSRPLSRRVATGKKTAWLAGDWGRDDHSQRDGSIGLAELGYGYNFGPAQLNVAIGKTWSNQDIVHGGDIDADGQYVIAETIVPMDETRGLYATLGAYGHWGDTDIDRGYLNAGLPDYSKGDPDTRTWGVRARVDWENAFTLSRTAFSPYADISYAVARMDGYTETGGGFLAYFDRRDEAVTELRAGINGALPLSNSTTQLLLNLEAAHRCDDKGTRTSGEMLGLFGFDLDGREYDQTWARGGIGVEGQLGQGKASLMLNGTTDGEMPNVWLAASYQVAF